ncbi:hypothetical protein [Haloferula sargassicola]|uniref:DUF998 domain-containing protein n=1 Tax=Haloferula sargassicola TaxID=490096 RepID=A0ABP9UN59_9BACT
MRAGEEMAPAEASAPMEGVARVLLGAGLGMFLLMQGLPVVEYGLTSGEPQTDWGYEIWHELFESAQRPADFNVTDSLSISGFLLSVACVAVAPFAVKLLKSSRLWWWLFFGCAAVAALAFTVIVGESLLSNYGEDYDSRVRVGAIAFLVFPYLTLAGLLCLRGKKDQSPEPT